MEIIGIIRKKYYNIINLKIKVDKKYLSKSVNMWYYRGRIRIKPDWNVKSYRLSITPFTPRLY